MKMKIKMLLILTATAGAVCAQSVAPEDKQLDPAWVESLTQRGHGLDAKITGSKAEDTLQYIGMPVGGIGCGTMYLGGDGRLWLWDIFNQFSSGVIDQICELPPELAKLGRQGQLSARSGANYVNPYTPDTWPTPFKQGFGIQIGDQFQRFEAQDWASVEFEGNWPIGSVQYRDPAMPVDVELRGFSPFIPLDVADSSLPLTCMEFTVRNTSTEAVTADLSGWLENAVGMESRKTQDLKLETVRSKYGALRVLQHSATQPTQPARQTLQPDIIFADFEALTYDEWVPEGDAFGTEPIHKNNVPAHQGRLNIHGERGVNSHASSPGGIGERDRAQGTLTGPVFTIERKHINFLIGGGSHKERTCLNLLVDGKVVRSATGNNSNKMEPASFFVKDLIGRKAQLQIVDAATGAWGNIGVDHIVFSDSGEQAAVNFAEAGDYGTLALGLLGASAEAIVHDGVPGWKSTLVLQPGESKKVAFLVAWNFPNIMELPGFPNKQHEYAGRFADAKAVAQYAAENYARLEGTTTAWVNTWYDSTLPNWFLDRTLLTTNTLQTANCYLFEDGQFWAWEGVGACPGTCTHVWQYAQSIGRLFPSLERNLREVTDYGYAQMEDGGIKFRGTYPKPAEDGQAGIILRTYREHLISADDAFLRRVWPQTKLALQYLIHEDGNADGILEGGQHCTLDAAWYGPVAWISGHYLAALRAGGEMARLMGDTEFAEEAEGILSRGQVNLVERLYNGEYFINLPVPGKEDTINSGSGCLIDQVFGQSWAFQVGLGRILPEEETRSALSALWKYNFFPDIEDYRKQRLPGRWYAVPGESGLLMLTFPKPDWDYRKASGGGKGFACYFNECMSGFEYQVASHMVFEGTPKLVENGLAVTRAVHDRYSPVKRNPYNEVECSDHYSRAAASYGVFLAACGFEYDGPKKQIGFAPRVSPEDFRAPFTAAEGWGTYSQKQSGKRMQAELAMKYGSISLRTLVLSLPEGAAPKSAKVRVNGQSVPCQVVNQDGRTVVQLSRDVELKEGQALSLSL